jgi:hypothetical protein
VWKGTGILLDGHNRLEICSRLEIPYKTVEIELPDRGATKLWIEENQLGRRNLTTDQRAAIAYRVMKRRAALSRRERARKGGIAQKQPINLVAASATKKTRLREIAALRHGVSERQIRMVTELAKHDPAVVERIVAGVLTIKDAKEHSRENARASRIRAARKSNPAVSLRSSGRR